MPAHEWTHVAAAYDGVSEIHYVAGQLGETDACGTGGSLAVTAEDFRIGARGLQDVNGAPSPPSSQVSRLSLAIA